MTLPWPAIAPANQLRASANIELGAKTDGRVKPVHGEYRARIYTPSTFSALSTGLLGVSDRLVGQRAACTR